jgi:hypothetical protein
MLKQVIIDIARRLRATMPVVDTNKGAIGAGLVQAQTARLNLALVLKQIVGLDHSHREFTIEVLSTVFVPQ